MWKHILSWFALLEWISLASCVTTAASSSSNESREPIATSTVESVREGETVRQRTVKALGRKDALAAGGELDRLAASIVRHSEHSLILSDIDAGRIESRRIGGPFLAAGCLCSMEQPGCLEGIVDPALVGHRHREAKRTGALADHGAIGS